MKIIPWNCRGLHRPAAGRALKALIREFDPVGIFLIETKCADEIVAKVMKYLGFTFFFSVSPLGSKGGLAFCWRPNLKFDVLLLSHHIFHLLVHPENEVPSFLCSLVYGPSLWKDKGNFWKAMELLEGEPGTLRVCLGDFNYVLCQSEKRGGRTVRVSSSRGLVNFLESHGYVDLGFSGRQFTWSNRRAGLAHTQERIDRSIANIPWRTAFPNATVSHHPIAPSDHISIILDFLGVEISVPKAFKFKGF